ncbi:hypothetical protein PC115_g15082 [Phytophthora cactorum]|uniref:Uncharacterized protein n=1 Tax=Phytophthora cactorum TaxID=29920 RepID=A0A8T1BKZ3_9STRA|nr:hypothetical protein PC115_g15082 [Phytophthora cactorum]
MWDASAVAQAIENNRRKRRTEGAEGGIVDIGLKGVNITWHDITSSEWIPDGTDAFASQLARKDHTASVPSSHQNAAQQLAPREYTGLTRLHLLLPPLFDGGSRGNPGPGGSGRRHTRLG